MAKRTYAKRRRFSPRRWMRRRRHRSTAVPILPLLGGVVVPMWKSFDACGGIEALKANPMQTGKGFLDQICQRYIGISPFPELGSGQTGWSPTYMIETYGGLIAGIAGHMLANKFGVNRYMKKIPLVGKYLSL